MSIIPQDTAFEVRNGFAGVGPATSGGAHRQRRTHAGGPRRLLSETLVLTGRILRRWSRDQATVAESLLMPVALLVGLDIVLGDGIAQVTGDSALYGSVPLAAMVGAMTGAMVGGIGLVRERADGLLARLWVLPVHRPAGLLARLLADAVRIVVLTAAIMCVGIALGFRFEQGPLAAVAWLFMPMLLGVAFSAAVITLALYTASTVMVELTEGIWALLMFFSTGFVPLDQFPEWVQPIVRHQPVSCVIEAMRGLSLGGPVLVPVVQTLLWSAGIIAVCLVPMALGYRRASMRG